MIHWPDQYTATRQHRLTDLQTPFRRAMRRQQIRTWLAVVGWWGMVAIGVWMIGRM